MFFEQLPTTITINNEEYTINTDFRIWLKFQKIVEKNNKEEEKLVDLIHFFTELNLPTSLEYFNETINSIVIFFSGGKDNNLNTSNDYIQKKYFDIEKDSQYIYSSFLSEYNINLTKVELHWYEFKALLQCLSSDCIFSKIIHYRTINLNDVPKEQKKFYKKMKEIYSLDTNNKTSISVEEYHQQMIDKVNKILDEVQGGV